MQGQSVQKVNGKYQEVLGGFMHGDGEHCGIDLHTDNELRNSVGLLGTFMWDDEVVKAGEKLVLGTCLATTTITATKANKPLKFNKTHFFLLKFSLFYLSTLLLYLSLTYFLHNTERKTC